MTLDVSRLVGRGVLLSTGLLVALVAGVGAVAVFAELQQTWRWYFRMERVVNSTAEPAVALSVVSLLGYVLLVGVADR